MLLLAGSCTTKPHPAFDLLVLAALAGAAGGAAARIAEALGLDREPCGRAAAVFTIAVAALTSSATILGHFGKLSVSSFLLSQAALLVACMGLPRTAAAPGPTSPAVPLGVTVAPPRRDAGWAALALRSLWIAATLALAVRLGGSLLHAGWDPTAYVLYDDLSFHLPAAAVWQRTGDLRMLKFETGDPSPTFYPITGELCSWAVLAPLHGDDLLARRTQLPFALLSLAAVAALARRLGADRATALLAALLYATVDRAFPVLALGAGNDHATAFFTLAAIDGGLTLVRRPSSGRAAYVGIALGLLVGTKYIGLLFAATVLGALGLLRALTRQETGHDEPRQAAPAVHSLPAHQALALIAFMMALCGGYAYARNAWATGNPVFPAPLDVWGHRVWNGWSTATLAWRRHLPEFHIDTLSFLLDRTDLFGALFRFVMLPAAILAPVAAAARRRLTPAVVLALPAAIFLEFRYLMHDHRDLRYFLPGLAIAAVAAGWLIGSAGPRLRRAMESAVLAGVLLAATARLRLDPWQQALALALLLAAGALASRFAGGHPRESWGLARAWRAGYLGPVPRWIGALVLAIAAAGAAGRAMDHIPDAKLDHQPAAEALERAVGAAGSHVAYTGSNEPYLFFGSRLQNVVEVVPTDGDLAAEYYTWGGSAHFPFDDGSAARWRANLAARHIAFVVAARRPGEGPEHGWMAADPSEFTPLYRDPQTEIWRFAAAAGAGGAPPGAPPPSSDDSAAARQGAHRPG